MKLRRVGIALALAAAGGPSAHAASFKWANDGDARAMDPYTFNETVQNSLLANIYERLVQHSRKLESGAGPGDVSWESTAPERLALPPAA